MGIEKPPNSIGLDVVRGDVGLWVGFVIESSHQSIRGEIELLWRGLFFVFQKTGIRFFGFDINLEWSEFECSGIVS